MLNAAKRQRAKSAASGECECERNERAKRVTTTTHVYSLVNIVVAALANELLRSTIARAYSSVQDEEGTSKKDANPALTALVTSTHTDYVPLLPPFLLIRRESFPHLYLNHSHPHPCRLQPCTAEADWVLQTSAKRLPSLSARLLERVMSWVTYMARRPF